MSFSPAAASVDLLRSGKFHLIWKYKQQSTWLESIFGSFYFYFLLQSAQQKNISYILSYLSYFVDYDLYQSTIVLIQQPLFIPTWDLKTSTLTQTETLQYANIIVF